MIKKFFTDTKKYLPYAVQSAKAQLKAEVANSYLNWIWWVLEPICFALIFYLVFGAFFKLKEDYMLSFILIGVSAWDFFNRMMVNAVTLMRSHKSIVSRIYLPKHILVFERIFVNGFKMCISLGLAVISMVIEGVQFTWRVVYIIPIFLVFLMFNFGLSCFLLHFGVFIADIR